jgi:hypothetical protein
VSTSWSASSPAAAPGDLQQQGVVGGLQVEQAVDPGGGDHQAAPLPLPDVGGVRQVVLDLLDRGPHVDVALPAAELGADLAEQVHVCGGGSFLFHVTSRAAGTVTTSPVIWPAASTVLTMRATRGDSGIPNNSHRRTGGPWLSVSDRSIAIRCDNGHEAPGRGDDERDPAVNSTVVHGDVPRVAVPATRLPIRR